MPERQVDEPGRADLARPRPDDQGDGDAGPDDEGEHGPAFQRKALLQKPARMGIGAATLLQVRRVVSMSELLSCAMRRPPAPRSGRRSERRLQRAKRSRPMPFAQADTTAALRCPT